MMKKIFPVIAGFILFFFLIMAIGLSSCGNAPAVPVSHYSHSILMADFDDCSSCHRTGESGAPKEPASHSNYANDGCLKCHKPQPGSS
jgi:hypothetical protein